jgi:hypothetical protein
MRNSDNPKKERISFIIVFPEVSEQLGDVAIGAFCVARESETGHVYLGSVVKKVKEI